MNKILEVCNVSKKFNTINGEIEAIKDVSFNIETGEIVAIVGTSGCGKSTLLSILANLEKQSKGEIIYHIQNPTIGYMLQEDALFEHLKVEDNILLGLKIQKKLNNETKKYALELLKKYNLYKFKDKKPNELSGGMKQRVALIRTLALKPDILFLDEPFSALDYSTRQSVCDDVYKIIKDLGKTTIIVTHDITEAVSFSDKIIVLSKGPAIVKNVYNINFNNKDIPTINKQNDKFNYYCNLIWSDLDTNI